jgi:hypothetical protein
MPGRPEPNPTDVEETATMPTAEAPTVADLAGPSAPTPITLPPRAAPMPVRIPDGDPGPAALEMLASLVPSTREETKQRIEGLERELLDLQDAARTDEQQELGRFITLTSKKVKMIAALEARLKALGSRVPDRPAAAVAVYNLITSIRRWRDGQALRVERERAIDRLRSEQAQVEADLQNLAAADGTRISLPTSVASGHHTTTGLIEHADEWLRRAEVLLTRRASIRDRVEALDAGGDKSRALTVTSALADHGGPERVAAAIAVAMPGLTADINRTQAVIAELQTRLGRIDPESRAGVDLANRLEDRQAALEEFQKRSLVQQQTEARAIIDAALTGGMKPLAELERLAGPGLAAAIRSIRGSDAELVAVTDELIASSEGQKPWQP